MSPESQQAQHHKGISKEVLIAVIGAIATILAAAVAAAIGLLPNLLAGQEPIPEPTHAAADSATPLPAVVTIAATPVAVAQPIVAPPAATGGYPCDATVSSWQAGSLNVVRDFPNESAMLRESIAVGTAVSVIDISGTALPWYRITSPEGRVLGWIPAEYLTLAATCPHS